MSKQRDLYFYFVKLETPNVSNQRGRPILANLDSSFLKSPKDEPNEIIAIEPQSPKLSKLDAPVVQEVCALCDALMAVGGENCGGAKFPKDSMAEHLRIHSKQAKMIDGKLDMADLVEPVEEGVGNENTKNTVVVKGKRGKKKQKKRKSYTRNSKLKDICQEVFSSGRSYGTCSLCLQKMKVVHSDRTGLRIRYGEIIDHASQHLGKTLVKCRHCDFEALKSAIMRNHLLKSHKARFQPGEYDDLLDQHWPEIGDMIRQCYGQADAQKESIDGKKRKIQRRSEPIMKFVSSPTHPLTADHHVVNLTKSKSGAALQKMTSDTCNGKREKAQTNRTTDQTKESTRKKKRNSDGVSMVTNQGKENCRKRKSDGFKEPKSKQLLKPMETERETFRKQKKLVASLKNCG